MALDVVRTPPGSEENLVDALRAGPITAGFADSAGVWLEVDGRLELVAGTHRDEAIGERLVAEFSSFSVETTGDHAYAQVVRSGEPFIGPPSGENPIWGRPGPDVVAEYVESTLIVPIVTDDGCVGALVFGSGTVDRFRRPDIAVAVRFATEISALVQRGPQGRAFAGGMSQLRALSDLSAGLVGAASIERVGRELMGNGLHVAGADGGSMMRWVDDHFEMVDFADLTAEFVEPWARFELQPGVDPFSDAVTSESGQFFTSREAFVESYPHFASTIESSEHHAWAVLPLIEPGGVVGALGFTYREPTAFHPARRLALYTLGSLASQALGQAIARQEIESTRAQLRTVLDSVFVNIALADAHGRLVDLNATSTSTTGLSPDLVIGRPAWETPAVTWSAEVAEQMRTEVETAIATRATRRFDIRASVSGSIVPFDYQIVPVLDDDGTVASLVLSSIDISARVAADERTQEALRTKERLVARLRVAVGTQRELVKHLQRSLLPSELPALANIEIAAVYRQATDHVDVGGDWYDAFTLPDGRLALTIGDIVGRGVEAAGATGMLRSATRALAKEHSRAAELVAHLDDYAADVPDAFASTTICALVDLESLTVELCRAGHVPPVVKRPGRDAEVVWAAGSAPLIQIAASDRTSTTFDLTPGSVLLMCTDGLIERADADLDVGLARLCELMDGVDDDLEASLHRIADRMADDGRTDDDVCIIAVRSRSSDSTD
ncbi:MAG: SpoIIE family protein phosphatase [Ilumatobacter sp.]|uniref:GAF domain-containing SpoIIE family protein phosphatase n=2 Tax=Ilumatobacter sp. TaxID=1967498 RepID=UPI003297F1DD